ncbi:carbohydrate ABC transporter permease [Cohnella cholangitidis]|uniref:Carbohydrate ABC transporter permease n=1 Tax=Cohnella cholangitidis TaxID=2598458 RepID=A0A7G5BVS1_9BACL|nr:carbohydrate ABC transporter permease [Cohnella cholangitidis]QMV41055.1 carbohydrate ABC transporter permease [Cohnella cholangitidis]
MKWVYRLVSLLFAFIFIIPLIWMAVVSIKVEGMSIASLVDWFTPPYSFGMYKQVIEDTLLLSWIGNSFLIAACVTALTVIIAAVAAFAMSKIPFRYKAFMFLFILSGLLIPGEAVIIPLYQVVKDLGMLNSYEALIVPVLASPVAVIVLKSFFDGVPNDLLESVQIDGGGEWRIFYNIMLPLTRPAIASMAILTFIASWNNYLWPFLAISDDTMFTLPIGIPTILRQQSGDYVMPMAVNMIASIPIFALFLVFERQIVKGISMSGIKG